ncbi:ABC transporter ATP-binding protein (plasmid) [Sinorhizobium mexicanum]|uniref:ABC transporter ATP-binding protein n=1 Tax=Sinorhizobium mexicanum TaxID=375549 RepID=A0A859QFY4_9HYPH|nr:ABC transporter ATP-binding protein [Sinorhizobium mexicanum]
MNPKPLLRVENLSVTLHTESMSIRPVRNVSYDVHAGRTVAIVGESGSGKTVMNMAPLGLLPAGVTSDLDGNVEFAGQNLLSLRESEMRSVRGGKIGVVFQDPLSALNPARKIGYQITEVIEHHKGLTAKSAEKLAIDLLGLVGIPDPASKFYQYPHELSGGMRQRVVIASGISAEPSLLVADEPTTALDVTVQAQIVCLLQDLQKRLGMAIVLVTHDIGVVSGMADDLVVMYAGSVVEKGPAFDILTAPKHPYTKALLASVPRLNAAVGSPFRGLAGLPPDLSKKLNGCAFYERCEFAMPSCAYKRPLLQQVGPTRYAACPLAESAVLEVAE